ncbi:MULTISPECIES: glycine--tRNA ligase [Halobacterium]|uniref:glycine--tRNA ligase n=1 Tax=Halobacterium TaxID=2239 RepID=UPI0019643A7E|nr:MULTISPECIES: glycine--tRNA ligase [Halobacterium]MDL0140547.1 glycine--tRNA ligase [Halobacterium salinarum]QRY22517.1 glycine--tRNA ligase [Halobacterium sp. GSL-19]QRY24582.1 glycine--tRNA ligase [Halobacterium sp. BOL4-2]
MSETVSELARRRGFFFQASEAYGGAAGFYTYGPEGAALKRNIEDAWRDRFVTREGNMEIDSPTVTPEPVFQASGHLDDFDDMLVECPDCGESHRADHVIEDNTDVEDAESMPTDEVEALIADHELVCPACGGPLAGQSVTGFNLMFDTTIGPGDGDPGYLRPETAQGMFTEFPRLKEYARNQLPFGVAQVGTGYRNEISPRNALLRTREFTMAELEFFVDPADDGPALDRVADVELPLYPVDAQQAAGEEYLRLTPQEALAEGVVGGEWVAYFLARSKQWFERVGVDMDRFRFRQHLPGELAHYASDCWDAEGEVDGDWVELEGVASRTDYDLSKHDEHADDSFTVFQAYDEPKTVERASVDPEMSYLGPEFGGAAGDVADALAALAARDRAAFDGDEVTVDVDGEAYTVPTERTGFEVAEETESGRHIIPHVVEPAFGIGRAVYTALAHSYEADEVDGEPRDVLRLPAEVAPTTVGVFPLMDKDGLGERAREIAAELRAAGLAVTYDDSGNIGRRYRRQDEVGTPYCVTVDYEALEEGAVTLRDRDTTTQVRVPIAEVAETLVGLRDGELRFEAL